MPAKRTPRHVHARRGTTLIEVMAAMVVMLVGAAGVAGLNTMGLRLDGDGRRLTRATAIAEDLAQQISLWAYDDPRLANANTANDDAIGDPTFELEATADAATIVDHAEGDLVLGGAVWNGIPTADLAVGGFERYWSVSSNDPAAAGTSLDYNANGVADGRRIAVIVRWPHGTGWRRVVLLSATVNLGDSL